MEIIEYSGNRSLGGEYHLGYIALLSVERQQKFGKNMAPPFSGSENKPRKKPTYST
jgi:hypothetical protein